MLPRSVLNRLEAGRIQSFGPAGPPARAYGIEENQFVLRFAEEPIVVYHALLRRRVANGPNFSYPELAETFHNIRKHIEWFRKSSSIGRKQATKDVMRELDAERGRLGAGGYPYQDSLIFVAKWVYVLDYLAFREFTQPEIEEAGMTIGECPSPNPKDQERIAEEARLRKPLERKRLARKIGCFIYWSTDTATSVLEKANAAAASALTKREDQTGAAEKELRPGLFEEPDYIAVFGLLLSRTGVVLLPSYNDLDAVFFTRIRQVPMFLLGILWRPSLNADLQNLSPRKFFEHDLFHAAQLSDTLLDRQGKLQPPNDERVYDVWDATARELRRRTESEADAGLRRALDIALFSLLHEPEPELRGATGDLAGVNYPSVLERRAMRSRLVEEDERFFKLLRMRYRDGQFERVDLRVHAALQAAVIRLRHELREGGGIRDLPEQEVPGAV